MNNDATMAEVAAAELARVDARGRISISRFAAPGASFFVHQQDENTIVFKRAVVLLKQNLDTLTTSAATPTHDDAGGDDGDGENAAPAAESA